MTPTGAALDGAAVDGAGSGAGRADFGVYVHVPFCAKRCDYCAFATWTDRDHLMGRYTTALRAELGAARAAGMPPATSVFFGGGTPSLLPGHDLMAVLGEIDLAPGAEVTVECNPDTVTPELFETYVAGGVNRVSLGVQSMVPHVLAGLGRTHHPANVTRAVDLARRVGMTTWNLDLIIGGAGETDDDWRCTLDEVLALEPPHLSVYSLTVEAGTPLAAQPDRHPDDDAQAGRYLVTDEVLSAAGLDWYEISNWARPGHECRHNLLYWAQGDYHGAGCAAHGHTGGARWWNVRTPERYVGLVEEGRSARGGKEELDADTRSLEAMQLALRTRHGVPGDALDGADPVLERLVDRQVRPDGERWVLTPEGRLLANEVAHRLRP